ncbi:hypothetical protein SAMN05660642_03860 [Geodermatophilus siccatus]|uniref:DUF732 domain-containing protein n=1 Tax=Geodermatophilus siccatus TaxID=1137991 RepID=A0A1G9Y384_9ACTN|nr:DUF732 domain-containing protein [Geodermatophilus siccatus]SDN03126.1 hypothetical protein SAMN05660642_03860 [Geodermatophilus siccatus]
MQAVEALQPDPDAFLAEMRNEGLVPCYGTAGEVEGFGQLMCDALAQGHSPDWIRGIGLESGINDRDSDTVLDASITFLRPEHGDQLEN